MAGCSSKQRNAKDCQETPTRRGGKEHPLRGWQREGSSTHAWVLDVQPLEL